MIKIFDHVLNLLIVVSLLILSEKKIFPFFLTYFGFGVNNISFYSTFRTGG